MVQTGSILTQLLQVLTSIMLQGFPPPLLTYQQDRLLQQKEQVQQQTLIFQLM